jgi:hypothetical protein
VKYRKLSDVVAEDLGHSRESVTTHYLGRGVAIVTTALMAVDRFE